MKKTIMMATAVAFFALSSYAQDVRTCPHKNKACPEQCQKNCKKECNKRTCQLNCDKKCGNKECCRKDCGECKQACQKNCNAAKNAKCCKKTNAPAKNNK